MRSLALLSVVVLGAVAHQVFSAYSPRPQAYDITPSDQVGEISGLLHHNTAGYGGRPQDNRKGLFNLLHASLHQNKPPTVLTTGQFVNELHPPVSIVVSRDTKVRKIPNRDGEVARRIKSGATVVALATTSDMLWIQIGQDAFIPTRDCRLEEPLNRERPVVKSLVPPLDIYVKEAVTARKIPDLGGKPVTTLRPNELISAIAVTPDYSWLMIGPNMFIPTISAKLGNPITPLRPPITIHLIKDTIVRDTPTDQGAYVTTLHKEDIMQAVGVTPDLKWLKISHNNYIHASAAKLGFPAPPTVVFPRPIVVQLIGDAPVVKNPNMPQNVIRRLKKDDELQAIGASADFKWLMVAKKRFIPMEFARMKNPIPKPIVLNPPVPIKLSKGVQVRTIPDNRGYVVSIARKGDKFDAIGVSADFTWLQLGKNMWIPMIAAYFRKAAPITNALVPPMKVTLLKDTKVYKVPDVFGKQVKTLGEGDTLTAVAATPDLQWLKVGEKQYILADGVKLDDQAATVPVYPFIKVVVTKDTKVYKQPNTNALPVHRLMRGEVLNINETTSDMKWLKISENQFIPTEFTAHIAHTLPLSSPVKVIVGADIKVRNVPSFAGMSVRDIKKGEKTTALETSSDFKWIKIAKDQYIPVSACVIDNSEGIDLLVVLKIRSAHVDKDPVITGKDIKQPDQKISTSQAASLLKQAFEKRINPPAQSTAAPVVDLEKSVKQLRVKEDTLVYNEPSATATPVKGLRAGALVDASGLGTNLVWLKIGQNQYIKLSATEPTEATTKK